MANTTLSLGLLDVTLSVPPKVFQPFDAGYSSAAQYGRWIQSELAIDPLYWLLVPYIIGQPIFSDIVVYTKMYEKNKTFFKYVMGGYNLIMSVFSLCCAAVAFYCLAFTIPTTLYSNDLFSEASGLYSKVTWVFYVSKYVEFLDTYFLVLCGRPVSWLQYIHHIGAVLDMGFLYHGQNDGVWIFVGFNGVIHTVMYYYYACCILKWKFTLMPKNFITIMQLIQFFTGLTIYYGYSSVEGFWQDERKRNTWYFTYAYVGAVTMLFFNFYLQTYIKKGAKSKDI